MADRIDIEFMKQVGSDLEQTFGFSFDLWIPGDPWFFFGPDGPTLEPAPPPEVVANVKSLGQREVAPLLWETSAGRHLLAMPFRRSRSVTAIATTTCDTSTAELLARMARLYLQQFQQKQELERLDEENEAYTTEVTRSFEELVFLRQMAEYLEVSDVSSDLGKLAETTLPLLAQSIAASSVVLIAANDPPSTPDATVPGPLVHATGSETVDTDTCRRLIEVFGRDAEKHPVVRNGFQGMPEGHEFPGVAEFILVSVAKGDHVVGWLLAVNRGRHAEDQPRVLSFPLSSDEFGTVEAGLVSSAASILASHARNVDLFQQKENLLISAIRSLVSAIEAKDSYTCGHSERVALFARRLAEEVGLTDDMCEAIYLAGLLHDLGKIGISDAVLSKPGQLDPEEFAEIQQHPERGWMILHDLEQLADVLPGVVHHHEHFDGTGYPDKLAGEAIPLSGRILAVADTYDALTSDRSYRKGLPQEKAEAILRSGSGTQWDPDLVGAFLNAMPDIVRIRESYEGRSKPSRSRSEMPLPSLAVDLPFPAPAAKS